jgi:hypothetical protein
VAGTLLTGFLLLDVAGTPGTLRLVALMGGVLVWLALQPGRRRDDEPARATRSGLIRVAIAGATSVAAFAIVPAGSALWPRLHGIVDRDVVYSEDATGLSLLKPEPENQRTAVFANGLGQSMLPFGGLHTVLGALPALVHPKPARIAVIGLGSGDTTYAAGGRPETVRIDSIEIVAAALDSLRQLAHRAPYPGMHELLADPRIRHHLTDGRAFLLRTHERYDIIEADALRPLSAYSGNLYSLEYFSLVRSRLSPGGFAVTWIPTPRVRATLIAAFPHVVIAGHVAIASEQPVPFDPDRIRERLNHRFTTSYYSAAGLDMNRELRAYLERPPEVVGPEFDRRQLGELNRDLFPRDEFRVR